VGQIPGTFGGKHELSAALSRHPSRIQATVCRWIRGVLKASFDRQNVSRDKNFHISIYSLLRVFLKFTLRGALMLYFPLTQKESIS
jgi:hypothetical protein